MQVNIWLAAIVGVLLSLFFYWLGYWDGESNANKRMLELQQKTEAAQKWKDILEKLYEKGVV